MEKKSKTDEEPKSAGKSGLGGVLLEHIPAVCTLDDIAKIFQTTKSTCYGWRKTGRFPVPALPDSGRLLFSGEVLRTYLRTNGYSAKRR